VTDGNLGAHLRKLEDAGYIAVKKIFVERKPRTFVAATNAGRQVFKDYTKALEAILKSGRKK
jgi:DNA-binding PadR family transcriptional regulator